MGFPNDTAFLPNILSRAAWNVTEGLFVALLRYVPRDVVGDCLLGGWIALSSVQKKLPDEGAYFYKIKNKK